MVAHLFQTAAVHKLREIELSPKEATKAIRWHLMMAQRKRARDVGQRFVKWVRCSPTWR